MKGRHDPDCSLLSVGAVGDAAAAEPALIGIRDKRGFPLGWVADKDVTHTDLDTGPTPVTELFVNIDMAEGHPMISFIKPGNGIFTLHGSGEKYI